MRAKIQIFVFVFICLFGIQSFVHAKDLHLHFHLKAGYAPATTAGPGKELISSFNQRLETIRNVGFFNITGFEDLKQSSRAPVFGGRFELSFNSRLSVWLGADFYLFSESGFFDVAIPSNDQQTYTYYRKYILRSFVVPVKTAVRYRIPFKRFFVYLEGGLGLYFEMMKSQTVYEDMWEEGESLLWKARGKAVVPFFGGGLNYRINRFISLSLEAGLPLARIQSFKITDCYEKWRVGEELSLFDEMGTTSAYSHQFRGLNIGFHLILTL